MHVTSHMQPAVQIHTAGHIAATHTQTHAPKTQSRTPALPCLKAQTGCSEVLIISVTLQHTQTTRCPQSTASLTAAIITLHFTPLRSSRRGHTRDAPDDAWHAAHRTPHIHPSNNNAQQQRNDQKKMLNSHLSKSKEYIVPLEVSIFK